MLWNRQEHLVAFSIYRQIPFNEISESNPELVRYAEAINRTPYAMYLKLGEIVNVDPDMIAAGNKIWPAYTPQKVQAMWDYMKSDPRAFDLEAKGALSGSGIA